jgi:hypothetical protein
MYIQYVGFDSAVRSRIYNFHVIDTPHEDREFTVSVGSAGFRAARLKLQDGPALCFARLKQELQGETAESRAGAHLNIEEKDIQEYLEQFYPRQPLARRAAPQRWIEQNERYHQSLSSTASNSPVIAAAQVP